MFRTNITCWIWWHDGLKSNNWGDSLSHLMTKCVSLTYRETKHLRRNLLKSFLQDIKKFKLFPTTTDATAILRILSFEFRFALINIICINYFPFFIVNNLPWRDQVFSCLDSSTKIHFFFYRAQDWDKFPMETNNCGSNLDDMCVKIRPMCCFCIFTLLTVTSTRSPKPTLPLNLPMLLLCTRPSRPTPQSTKAPNDVIFVTRPLSRVPGWRSSSEVTSRLNKGFWKSK